MSKSNGRAGGGKHGPAARLSPGPRRDAIRLASRRSLPLEAGTKDGTAAWSISAPSASEGRRPHVFVSYSRKDLGLVRRVVKRLRAGGVPVVWDQEFDAGSDFRKQITDAIDGASCVVVVWSASSVRSDYVVGEAARAQKQSKLVPLYIDGLDFDDVPIGLGHLQAVPVRDWRRVTRSLAAFGVVRPA